MAKTCTNCGTINANEQQYCANCGNPLPAVTTPAAPIPPAAGIPAAPAAFETEREAPKFGAIRTMSVIYRIMAWFWLVGGIIFAIAMFAAPALFGDYDFFVGIIPAIAAILVGLLMFLSFQYTAQLNELMIHLEGNTRETSALLRRMLRK